MRLPLTTMSCAAKSRDASCAPATAVFADGDEGAGGGGGGGGGGGAACASSSAGGEAGADSTRSACDGASGKSFVTTCRSSPRSLRTGGVAPSCEFEGGAWATS